MQYKLGENGDFLFFFPVRLFFFYREGQSESRKEKECNTPEAVYRSKVVSYLAKPLLLSEAK